MSFSRSLSFHYHQLGTLFELVGMVWFGIFFPQPGTPFSLPPSTHLADGDLIMSSLIDALMELAKFVACMYLCVCEYVCSSTSHSPHGNAPLLPYEGAIQLRK